MGEEGVSIKMYLNLFTEVTLHLGAYMRAWFTAYHEGTKFFLL